MDALKRWPRKHFSWSQFHTFRDQGPNEYIKKYLYGENETNPAMELGKIVAEMIEKGDPQEDTMLEHLRIFLPPYEHHEFELRTMFCGIPLVAFLDGFDKPPNLRLGEYKTGRLWTQDMADKTEQLDWYVLMLHLIYKIKPEDIPIVLTWMPTEWNNGDPQLTGEIMNFVTQRSMRQCLDIGKKIVDTWAKIGEFCGKEYQSIGI